MGMALLVSCPVGYGWIGETERWLVRGGSLADVLSSGIWVELKEWNDG